jgi:pyrimidine-specific ribonucleoside hydrolase
MTRLARKTILDVDTGVDDALALLTAVSDPLVDLLAVSCVSGNTDVDQVVDNTLRVLEIAGGTDIPVARGASCPLIEERRHAEHFHGSDGMGDLGLGPSARGPVDRPAIEFVRQLLIDSEESSVTLVCLGPLTNIALLLRAHPEVASSIDRIVMMGGAVNGGNATAVAEFNVWADPEAASIILTSELPVTMYGLDVYHQAAVAYQDVQKLRTSGDPVSELAARLLEHLRMASDPNVEVVGSDRVGIGDAGALFCAIRPDLLTTRFLPVGVELSGHFARGQTVTDLRYRSGEQEHHGFGHRFGAVDVGVGINDGGVAQGFLDLFRTE